MDDETTKHLLNLTQDNIALFIGLKIAIINMQVWDDLTPKRRLSVIESLQMLISQINKVHETEATQH
jgi:hypothetical protein